MRILQKNLHSMFGRAEMRDNQRTVVYRWEATCSRRLVRLAEDSGEALSTTHCHYSSEFETLQECADFLKPVWTSERGRYGHARTPPPAVIRPHRGQRRALAKHSHELSLPKWSRNRWVILHEAAHRLNVGYEAHGPRFVGILIGLLSRHAGVRRKKVELVNERKLNCRPPQPSGLPNCHEPTRNLLRYEASFVAAAALKNRKVLPRHRTTFSKGAALESGSI